MKDLSLATVGDITTRTCELCGKYLELHEIDRAENIGWLSCPEYLNGHDEHTSYSVPLRETGEAE
jgi:hypothetical protein